MRVFSQSTTLDGSWRDAAVVIGNFDGVHLGHQYLIDLAKEEARKSGKKSGVITFEPHPRQFFSRSLESFRLSTTAMKRLWLSQTGIDFVVEINFDPTIAGMTPKQFVKQLLIKRLGVKNVVTGKNFKFGRNRTGSVADLENYPEFTFHAAPDILCPEQTIISSSRIRGLLEKGELTRAQSLLGRNWAICGQVASGDKRGTKLGFPTANIVLGETLCPKRGVYAIEVNKMRAITDPENKEPPLHGLANVGNRPTFKGSEDRLEAHLLDFDGDLYGKDLHVKLLKFVREEIKFESVPQLTDQIQEDLYFARTYFSQAQMAQ